MSSEEKTQEVSKILVAAAYDTALMKLQSTLKERNIDVSSKTITEIVKIAMEIVESTKLKGAEQKALVEKIVRKIIVDSPLEESKKSIVISMLDEGIVGDVIELVVSATKGELDINSVEKVATGCCLAFLKSRKSRNQKLTSNPLH
tara:strand:- start:16 stop:453 length:438 start_codon:yes stop_codon:yes gene_type:complete